MPGIERPLLMLEVRGSNRTPATPLKKIPLLYPETLEVPIRGRVQLRILELGDQAGEKQKIVIFNKWRCLYRRSLIPDALLKSKSAKKLQSNNSNVKLADKGEKARKSSADLQNRNGRSPRRNDDEDTTFCSCCQVRRLLI